MDKVITINPHLCSKQCSTTRCACHTSPILQERINGRPLVWLDNAHKNRSAWLIGLLIFINMKYSPCCTWVSSSCNRRLWRNVVARFIGTPSSKEIILEQPKALTWLQKHGVNKIWWWNHRFSLRTPCQYCALLTKKTGVKLRVIPVDDTGF